MGLQPMRNRCSHSRRRLQALPRRIPVATLVACLVLAAAAPVADGDIGETIIQRCTHGESLSGFTPADYRRALEELSADTEEYTDCSSLIRQAELAAAAGKGSTPLAAPITATPTEAQALTHAARSRPASLKLGGQLVNPGVVHANIASAISTLPTPLLATIAFILACVVAYAGSIVRNRIRARRSD